MNCEEMKTSHFPNPLPLCIALLPMSAWNSHFCLFLFRQKLICKTLCQSLMACASPLGYSCRSRMASCGFSLYITAVSTSEPCFLCLQKWCKCRISSRPRICLTSLRTSFYLWLKNQMIQLTIQLHILSTNNIAIMGSVYELYGQIY